MHKHQLSQTPARNSWKDLEQQPPWHPACLARAAGFRAGPKVQASSPQAPASSMDSAGPRQVGRPRGRRLARSSRQALPWAPGEAGLGLGGQGRV